MAFLESPTSPLRGFETPIWTSVLIVKWVLSVVKWVRLITPIRQ
jgi:hypothetical protein